MVSMESLALGIKCHIKNILQLHEEGNGDKTTLVQLERSEGLHIFIYTE